MRRALLLGGVLASSLAGPSLAQYAGPYQPPLAYAYAGQEVPAYRQEGYGPGFTLLGARAGFTVLGFDLGAGAHLSFDGGRHHQIAPPAYVPYMPPPPYPQQAYGQPVYAAPQAYSAEDDAVAPLQSQYVVTQVAPEAYYAPPPPPQAYYAPPQVYYAAPVYTAPVYTAPVCGC